MSGLRIPAPAPSTEGPAPAAPQNFPVYEPKQQPTADNNTPSPFKEYHKAVQEDPDDQKELLFTIDDVPYYLPRIVPPREGFRYLRDIKDQGREYAVAAMVERLMGRPALDALCDCTTLTEADYATVQEILEDKVLAATNVGRGKGK